MKRNYEIAVISKGAFARTVRIFNGASADSAILLLDGQSAFTDEYSKTLFKLAKAKKLAVIGIDGTATRFFDYLPFKSETDNFGLQNTGGGAEQFSDYIFSTLIPYLDKRFGFKSYSVFGQSLSAATAVYIAGKTDAQKIQAFGIIDPPLFVSPAAFDKFFKENKLHPAFYYIGCTGNADPLPEVPQAMYSVSAISIAAALANNNAKNVILKIKTDAQTAPVFEFIDHIN